jgi:hypothetical protein
MELLASSFLSLEPDSLDAGRLAGEALAKGFGSQGPKAVMVYATMNHDQPMLLQGLRAALGPDVPLLGCSVQGVVSNGELTEEGLALGVMGFGGGALRCASAIEREVQVDSREKGRAMAARLKRDLGEEPKIVLVLYDPLCGLDVETLLSGLQSEIRCPLIGGGAGQPWGPPVQTFQFWDREVLSHGAVALALAGPFSTEIGICHGTAPTGIKSVVTKAAGNQVLEIDGRPAADVWRQATGADQSEMIHQSHMASWALGIERKSTSNGNGGPREEVARVIRGAFGFNPETGAMILQAAIPEGANVMLHHRTVENVLSGTDKMAQDLAKRISGRRPWAVLGFECAARTYPFLGAANTLKEHESLRTAVAPAAPWLGMMAWGEIGPCAGQPAFHNYTYPVAVFMEEDAA